MRPHHFHLLAAIVMLVASIILAFFAPIGAVFALVGAVVAALYWRAGKSGITDT